jgi:hypothetical protein
MCGRLWVRAQIGTNKRLLKFVFVDSLLITQHLSGKTQRLVGSEAGYNVSEWGDMSIHRLLFQGACFHDIVEKLLSW